MSLFAVYCWVLAIAIVASFYNLRQGDGRLTIMALSYTAVIVLFHVFLYGQFHELGLRWYLYVGAAQWGIGFIASEIRCKSANLIRPLAYGAVLLNLGTWVVGAHYPHMLYWWAMNLIQGAQVASLFVANYAVLKLPRLVRAILTKQEHGQHRMGEAHESSR